MRRLLIALALVTSCVAGLVGTAGTATAADTLVGSSYLHPDEYTPVHSGALELGVSDAQYQKMSVGVISFIFGVAGITSQPAAAPGPGNHTITTTWTPSELAALDHVAGVFQLNRAQAQKLSSLIVAFLLGLS